MNTSELRSLIAGLEPLPAAKRFTWNFRRNSLRESILTHDPEKFLMWPISKDCLYVGNVDFVVDEYHYLLNHPNMYSYSPAVAYHPFGAPERYEPDPSSDPNLIHQTYYVAQFEEKTGLRVEKFKDVYEFGGGYGAMKFVLGRLGFDGYYFCQDFPEFSILQQYYLTNVGSDLIGSVFKDWTPKLLTPDLFIACCSLSESPVALRREILYNVIADNYLIVYQHNWDGINNHEFFLEFQDDRPGIEWSNYRCPSNGNHWLLMGRKA